ncbi:hypothetical protein MicB006_3537 [Micromonospora sp. B006]|nr:hypothetical protein MicB006_3537 [Micromonospora sp. B006]
MVAQRLAAVGAEVGAGVVGVAAGWAGRSQRTAAPTAETVVRPGGPGAVSTGEVDVRLRTREVPSVPRGRRSRVPDVSAGRHGCSAGSSLP